MLWTFLLPALALFAILLFWFLLRNRPKKMENVLITEHTYRKALSNKEILRTAISLLIFLVVGAALDLAYTKGFTQIYTNNETSSLIYLPISFFLALGINDVYFYFSHRFLHWKFLFKNVHHIHHQSHYPNPWSSFSFHPVEAVIQIGIIPLVAMVLPIHVFVLIGFSAFMLLVSVYGHCGYELRANKPPIFAIFNNSIHHNQHHQFFKYNFGLYLNLWDRIFKTNHPTYDEVTEKFKLKANYKH